MHVRRPLGQAYTIKKKIYSVYLSATSETARMILHLSQSGRPGINDYLQWHNRSCAA